jgi:hypothetical protein
MSERGSGTSENAENSEKDYPSQKLGSEDAEDIIQHCYVIDKNDYRLIPINLKKAQQIKSNKNEYSSFKRSMGGFAMEFEETKLLICLSKKFPYFYIDLNDLTMHKPGAEDASELKAHVKQNDWDIVSTSAGTVYNAEEALLVDFSNSEDAEDMSKSPFHYDPMHGLERAAHEIKDTLKSAANDEARTEHIEKMAEIILGPQSEYASVGEYKRILGGVIELLNHYVVVPMN